MGKLGKVASAELWHVSKDFKAAKVLVLALSRCRAVMCGGTSAQDTSAERQSVSCVQGGSDFSKISCPIQRDHVRRSGRRRRRSKVEGKTKM